MTYMNMYVRHCVRLNKVSQNGNNRNELAGEKINLSPSRYILGLRINIGQQQQNSALVLIS